MPERLSTALNDGRATPFDEEQRQNRLKYVPAVADNYAVLLLQCYIETDWQLISFNLCRFVILLLRAAPGAGGGGDAICVLSRLFNRCNCASHIGSCDGRCLTTYYTLLVVLIYIALNESEQSVSVFGWNTWS